MKITAKTRQEFIDGYKAWNGVALKLARAHGYLYDYEVLALYTLAYSLPQNSVVVNIGAGSGTSALAFMDANPSLQVYTVDISRGGWMGGLQNELNAFAEAGIPRTSAMQILGDSQSIGSQFDKKIDLLFIDADHSAEGLRKDIQGWLPHLNKGGFVCFHDYGSPDWGDVAIVADEEMKKAGFKQLFVVDTLAVYS